MSAPVIGVIANKGGVGKTTLAQHFASELAFRGNRVLAVDADRQADLSWVLGQRRNEVGRGLDLILSNPPESLRRAPELVIRCGPNLDLIRSSEALETAVDRMGQYREEEATFFLKEALEPLLHLYDYAVIDLGHASKLVKSVAVVTDLIVMPTRPTALAANHAGDVLQQAGGFRRALGLPFPRVLERSFIVLWRNTANALAENQYERILRERYPNQVAPAVIRNTTRVDEAQTQHLSLRAYREALGTTSDGPLNAAIQTYSDLTDFLVGRLQMAVAA